MGDIHKCKHGEIMKNIERLQDDQIWEPCFFGKSLDDPNIKSLKQLTVPEESNSKLKVHVSHLLDSVGVSSSSSQKNEDWIDIIARLSWEAAHELLNPFISGNPIDPNAYIKVKCIAAGSSDESQIFKGLVFTKHATHKHMETKYEHPRILLVKGQLDEQPITELSSFREMTYSQERNYKTRVFIEASQPDVILVEKSVSRDLQYYILCRGITLVTDMNLQRLEMISSCIGSPIVAADSLVGHKFKSCHSFRIENIVEEHHVACESGKQKSKTLMFLERHPNSRLGCTILLKGSDIGSLKKLKRVLESSVILAYHLILEISFHHDQQAMLSTILSTPQKMSSCIVDDKNHQLLFDPIVANTNYDNFEPGFDVSSIMVFVSRRNAHRGIICEPSHFMTIMFYKNFDVSVEKFLRDLFNQGSRCNACEELPQAHFYYYEYRKIQLRIELKRLRVGKRLPGESNGNIWMWSRCGKDVTEKVLMSIAARCLSFGKFLDLTFSQQTLLHRSSSCGDSFLHFYGLGYMVAMFSYSQVATYTAILPPLMKLEVSNSIRARWLEKEFQNVITKGIIIFHEVTNFLKQLRSDIESSSCPGHHYPFQRLTNIEEILKRERTRFMENIKNHFDKAKTLGGGFHKLLCLNRTRWELFLQALVWKYRLQSLVLYDHISYSASDNEGDEEGDKADSIEGMARIEYSDKNIPYHGAIVEGNDLIEGSSVQEVGRDGSNNNHWFWSSFEEISSKSIVDIEKEYKLKSKNVCNFFQENLRIVNEIVIEEGSRLHISLGGDYCVVSDYEDELSSLVACALAHLSSNEKIKPQEKSFKKDQVSKETVSSKGSKLEALPPQEILVTFGTVNSHGNLKYSVVSLYEKDFCDLRKRCCFSELEYIDSLSRCEQWNAKDEKENTIFSKTIDERFIVREIERMEYESFVKFGLEYFKYMKETYELGNQTCLAKVFGIYQVIIRKANGQREIRHNLMVMENLNFGRNISHEYNLKGPLLTRFITTSDDGDEEIMLGPKFFKEMNNTPVYFNKVSKHNLQSAIRNDFNFLDSISVMDYSLLVGVDLERRELVCGIVNYLKLYTWDMSYPCRIL